MKPNIETWTIVIAGGWNAQIFTPEWVGEKILGINEFEIQLIFQGNTFSSSFRTPEIIFTPTNNQVVCGVRNSDESTLTKAESSLIKILEMLPYTPINAVGINFGFSEENPSQELLDLFNFNDTYTLIDKNYLIKENQIYRQIAVEDRLLNLRQTLSAESSEAMSLHFNFHKDVSNANEAVSCLKDRTLEFKRTAYKFLEEVYQKNVEEDSWEENNGDAT